MSSAKEITLQLLRPRSVTKGQALLVFSNLAVAGKTIAVREVAHYDAASSAAMISQIADSVRRQPEADLQTNVTRAADIRWFRSPKLQPGQTGVFLMTRSRERGLDGYTVQGPLDFQPLAVRERSAGEPGSAPAQNVSRG
ncbi:MAG TPA: hypothetical protein VH138_10335 [Vicinamibacterales bacterium]|nr:hypothetical protein [Vicinamibacterales bacterium]